MRVLTRAVHVAILSASRRGKLGVILSDRLGEVAACIAARHLGGFGTHNYGKCGGITAQITLQRLRQNQYREFAVYTQTT